MQDFLPVKHRLGRLCVLRIAVRVCGKECGCWGPATLGGDVRLLLQACNGKGDHVGKKGGDVLLMIIFSVPDRAGLNTLWALGIAGCLGI